MYADNAQIYISSLEFSLDIHICISDCLFGIFTWISSRYIKLSVLKYTFGFFLLSIPLIVSLSPWQFHYFSHSNHKTWHYLNFSYSFIDISKSYQSIYQQSKFYFIVITFPWKIKISWIFLGQLNFETLPCILEKKFTYFLYKAP